MKNYFECGVSYDKTMENGMQKKVTEPLTLDEKAGTEKKTATYMLAQASDIDEARKVIKKGMEGTMSDYVIESLTETKIEDVFPYSEDDKKVITL